MDKIIATVIGIILVLGLIAYAILGQVEGVKKSGDKATMEQEKINRMLEDPSIVTGTTVKNYASQDGITISVKLESGSTYTTKEDINNNVTDSALFKMTKTYNADGALSAVSFEQQNLSTTK